MFSSTCASYGIPGKVPITEDEPQRPINPYGRSKLMVEMALADYAAAHGWGYAALRYFNAAGASPQGDIGEDQLKNESRKGNKGRVLRDAESAAKATAH